MDNLGTTRTTRRKSSPDALKLSPVRGTLYVVNDYSPDRDGELLTAGEVCALLHVSRSHLPNLRANGALRGYRMHPSAYWRYPSRQPTLAEAAAALKGHRA